MSNNHGWVKLSDPKTGKAFYANHVTRKTQWQAPPGFVDEDDGDDTNFGKEDTSVISAKSGAYGEDTLGNHVNNSLAAAAAAAKQNSLSRQSAFMKQKTLTSTTSSSSSELPLPSNWEMRHDPKSNRPFYIDHERKITTWEHPLKKSSTTQDTATTFGSEMSEKASSSHGYNGRASATNPQHSQSSRMSFSSTASHNSFSSTNTHQYTQSIPTTKDDESTSYYKRLQSSNHHFSVIEIPDKVRKICPSCKMIFSTLNRRHHCRSCGDVFCHDCSKNKVLLPLDGEKYKIPVRVCNSCHVDCSRGNYFTMRRYWTILDIFNGNEYKKNMKSMDATQAAIALIAQEEDGNLSDYEGGSGVNKGKATDVIIRPENVAGAFLSLSQDLDTLLQTFYDDGGRSFKEKLTMNPKILMHLITKHLVLEDTSDVAIQTLATLFSLSNVVYGHDHEDIFVHAFYLLHLESPSTLSLGSGNDVEEIEDPPNVWNDLCSLLEWYGTSTKTIAVQEQAARVLFYLTEPKVISSFLAKEDESLSESSNSGSDESIYPSYGEVEDGWATRAIEHCDVHRLLKNLLDLTTSTGSTCLQRWAAASFRNLIAEDFRRASDSITNAMLCGNGNGLVYESFTYQLISAGGIMILSSLMGADDSDVRAHATATLSSIITNVRDLNRRLDVWKEATGGNTRNDAIDDVAVIDAIVSSGACGLSLTQLLLSADNATAIMGCNFAMSMVQPILTNPIGSELVSYQRFLHTNSAHDANDSLSSFRNAAMALAKNDGVLPALIQLSRNNDFGGGRKRSLELWSCAIDVLAAIALTISHMDGKRSQSERNKKDSKMNPVHKALLDFEEEDIGQVLLEALSSIRINAINTSRDSPASKVRESASLILSAIASCSGFNVVDNLIMSNVLTDLISASAEEGMSTESICRRGTWAPRYLALTEAVASVAVYGWKIIQNDASSSTNDGVSPTCLSASSILDMLIEMIDAGILPFVSSIVECKVEYHDHEKAYANMRLQIAACHIVASMFGICQSDKTSIGMSRLFEAVYANTGSSSDNMGYPQYESHRSARVHHQRDIISSLIVLLRSLASESQQNMSQTPGPQGPLPHGKLIEACILAVGSVCGSSFCPFTSIGFSSTKDFSNVLNMNHNEDQFTAQFEEVCKLSCDAVAMSPFLPSALVGVFGEGAILPSLRFISALAQHSTTRVHQKLAKSGILVPISDMMSDALSSGDFYTFTLSVEIIGLCGAQLSASTGESSGLKSIRNSVQLLSNVISIEVRDNAPLSEQERFKLLKKQCLLAIERLSTNSSTLSVIASSFVPAISSSLSVGKGFDGQINNTLRVILRVVSMPSYAKTVIHSGIVKSLSEFVSDDNMNDGLAELILEILHTLACHTVRSKGYEDEKLGLIQHGAVKVVCSCLVNYATMNTSATGFCDSILITKLGFEIIQFLLSGIGNIDKAQSLQSSCFVKAILPRQTFIKTLCSTLLTQSTEEDFVKQSMYGDPLILFDGECATYSSPLEGAIAILVSIASLCTVSSTEGQFWDTFLLTQDRENCIDERSRCFTSMTLCSIFMQHIADESSFIYRSGRSCVEVTPKVKLLLLKKIIQGCVMNLKWAISVKTEGERGKDTMHSFMASIIERYAIIQTTISLCCFPNLVDSAMELAKIMLLHCEDAFFLALGSDRQAFSILFDMLDNNSMYVRQVVANILSKAGDRCILGPVVNSFGLRNIAIASLSAACLREEEYTDVGIEKENDSSSHSNLCLKALLSVISVDPHEEGLDSTQQKRKIFMSPSEATAICVSLGQRLSEMVLNQLLQKAQRKESSLQESNNLQSVSSTTESPEVTLLCALASQPHVRTQLFDKGGLEALSLIAAEGEVSALAALCEVCKDDPKHVIEVDGHISAMQVFMDKSRFTTNAVVSSIELLVNVCTSSKTARKAVSTSDQCSTCIMNASEIIGSFAESLTPLISLCDEAATPDSDENLLEISALSFLTVMNREKKCRDMIRKDDRIRKSIKKLTKEDGNSVQHAVIDFLGSMCCFVGENDTGVEEQGYYTAESVTAILIQLLEEYAESKSAGNQTILASIIGALESILSHMNKGDHTRVFSLLAVQFASVISENYMIPIKKLLSQKKTTSAFILHLITSILLRLLYNIEHHRLLIELDVMSGFVKLIVIDYFIERSKHSGEDSVLNRDDRVSVANDQTYWKSAVTQSLQCLTLLDSESYAENCISSAEVMVIHGVESASNSISKDVSPFYEALQSFNRGNVDAVRFISSQRIMQKLEM